MYYCQNLPCWNSSVLTTWFSRLVVLQLSCRMEWSRYSVYVLCHFGSFVPESLWTLMVKCTPTPQRKLWPTFSLFPMNNSAMSAAMLKHAQFESEATLLYQDKQKWVLPVVPHKSVMLNCSSLQHHLHCSSLQFGISVENYTQFLKRVTIKGLNKFIHCPLHLS